MGTEILHPHDLLSERLRSLPSISPRRNPRSCRKQAKRSPQPDPIPKKPYPDESRSVRFLVWNQSLDSKRSDELKRNDDLKKSVSLNEADLIVCGTERLGPDPELVPKQIRLMEVLYPFRSDGYAGSAFSQSPSPSSLPLPSFSRRKCMSTVDDSATKDLRRLLRLD